MASCIFLINNNELTRLNQTPYQSEDLLQQLLAEHPDLLASVAGEQGRLLCISREFGVPEKQAGPDRWALDHLFVDTEGVPIFVETKRASNTQLCRDVVAQMLDYAANGVAFWSIKTITETFSKSCGDPDARLAEFLNDSETEDFWRRVDANLRAGRIRLVFVADQIPAELRRIVEFLNEQMPRVEVLAVEIEQFADPSGIRTLVPRLIGNTQRAAAAKSVDGKLEPISEEEWWDTFREKYGDTAALCAERLAAWFRSNGFLVRVTNAQDAVQVRVTQENGKPAFPFYFRRGTGMFDVALTYLKSTAAYQPDQVRQRLLDRLREIPNTHFTAKNPGGWASTPVSDLADPTVSSYLQTIALEIRDRLQSTIGPSGVG